MAFFNAIYYAIYCFARHVRDSEVQSRALAGAFVAAFVLFHGMGLYFLCAHLGGFKMLPANEAKPYVIGATVILLALSCLYYVWLGNGERVIAEMKKRRDPQAAAKLGGVIVVWIIVGPLLTLLVFVLVKNALK